jgi:Ser/Thr protein kinase RdoA (MazF antagonist)
MLGTRLLWGDWHAGLGLRDDGRKLLQRVADILKQRLDTYGNTYDRFGLVHADLRLANLLVDGARLGVIDFDDCGFSWFFYDFAAAVSFMEHEPVVAELQASWLDGYRAIAPVSHEDELMLPVFVMLRRMLLTAWIASHSDTETARRSGTDYTDGTVAMGEQFLRTFRWSLVTRPGRLFPSPQPFLRSSLAFAPVLLFRDSRAPRPALHGDEVFPVRQRHHNFRYPRTIFRILQASPATQNSVCDGRRVRKR